MPKCLGKYTPEAFAAYDKLNPHIWETFKHYADLLAARREGKTYSAKKIFHGLRWETDVRGVDPHADFKIDDGWISHYARKWLDLNPQYPEFFKLRARRVSYHNEADAPPLSTGGPQNALQL